MLFPQLRKTIVNFFLLRFTTFSNVYHVERRFPQVWDFYFPRAGDFFFPQLRDFYFPSAEGFLFSSTEGILCSSAEDFPLFRRLPSGLASRALLARTKMEIFINVLCGG